MAYSDAQGSNTSDRNVRQYSDLDLFFSKKATSKDISKVTDVKAVKRSVRNLILTNPYEKPFHPEIGSGVRDLLFENMTPFTAQVLSQKIKDVITNYEPRALLAGVECVPRLDQNMYEVIVTFYIQNAPAELIDLSFTLERLR